MIRIAVCDDDERMLEQTLKLLKRYRKAHLVTDVYTSGKALLTAGKTYDIVLLDIDMDGLNGISAEASEGRGIVRAAGRGLCIRAGYAGT